MPRCASTIAAILRRSGAPDRGALEYPVAAPCGTTKAGGGADLFQDGFETGGTGQWSLRLPWKRHPRFGIRPPAGRERRPEGGTAGTRPFHPTSESA